MKTFKIKELTNFLRVFRLPKTYPEGFCFGGGYPVTMQLVDWFNPFPTNEIYGNKIKRIEGEEYENHIEMLKDFIKGKNYFDNKSTYLAIADYGDSFVIKQEAADEN
jgi:hypothetical protein